MLRIAIFLLVIINVLSMATINIPIGGESTQPVAECSIVGGEYGKLVKNKWHPIDHLEFNHIPKEQRFRRCVRIKDRFRELLFA